MSTLSWVTAVACTVIALLLVMAGAINVFGAASGRGDRASMGAFAGGLFLAAGCMLWLGWSVLPRAMEQASADALAQLALAFAGLVVALGTPAVLNSRRRKRGD